MFVRGRAGTRSTCVRHVRNNQLDTIAQAAASSGNCNDTATKILTMFSATCSFFDVLYGSVNSECAVRLANFSEFFRAKKFVR